MKIKLLEKEISLTEIFLKVWAGLAAILILAYCGFWLLLGEQPQFN